MASLSTIKNKLHRIKKEDTSEVTDHQTWMRKIQGLGNRPEDWLEFTNYMRQNTNFCDRFQAHNFLSDLYEKSFRAINGKENKDNPAYAYLFVNFAEVKSEHLPEDAIQILTEARNMVRKFAIVHVASAELEAREGNTNKASRILMKAKMLKAEPLAMIEQAMKKLEAGETVLLSPRQRKLSSSTQPSPLVSTDTGDTSSLLQQRFDPVGSRDTKYRSATEEISTHGLEDMETAPIMLEADKEKFISVRSNSCRPVMRAYNSTPEMRSLGNANWKQKGIGLPQRVRKLNLPPLRAEEEEDNCLNDTMDGFAPLEPQASSTFVSMSSGYQSMMDTNMSRLTCEVSGIQESKDRTKTQNLSLLKPIMEPELSPQKPSVGSEISLLKPNMGPEIIMGPVDGAFKENLSVPGAKPESVVDSKHRKPLTVEDPTPRKPLAPRPIPNTSVEPTPSKQILSNVSLSLPVQATPSIVSAIPAPCTPSVRNDTITVNNNVYLILDMIGKGGSSKVYRVHDSMSEPCLKAIKVVNLNDANEEIVNGYKNEVQLLLQLQYCPKVIKIYDYEFLPNDGKLYIVMEYGSCDFGKFLKEKITEDGRLTDHLIKYYWDAMLKAVQALHNEGVIHSDLKPSNFIINGGLLKLIDFGIAKSVQPDKTSVLTETQVGTLNYMSPESIMDHCSGDEKPMYKISIKSDVWSLGCMLYNMVYGYTPFQKITKQFAKLQAIINPNYTITFPEIADKHLMDVMKKCLIRDPKVRPSIEELLEHPYLKNEKKEVPETSVADDNIERLVKKLADKFASSPNTVRSLVRSEFLSMKK